MLKKLIVLLFSAVIIIACNHGTNTADNSGNGASNESTGNRTADNEGKASFGNLGGNVLQPVKIANMSEYIAIGTAYKYSNNNLSSILTAKDDMKKKVVIVGLKADGTVQEIAVESEDGNQNLENIMSFTKLTDDYSFITISNSEYNDDINSYNTSMFINSTVKESDYLINMNSGKMHELKWVYAEITKDLLEANGLPYMNEYLTDQSYFNGFDGLIRNQMIVANGDIYVFAYLNLCNKYKNIVKGEPSAVDEWYKKGYVKAYDLGKFEFEERYFPVFEFEGGYEVYSYLKEKYNCNLDEFILMYFEDLKNNYVDKYNFPEFEKECIREDFEANADRYEYFKRTVKSIFETVIKSKIKQDGFVAEFDSTTYIVDSILDEDSDITDSQMAQLIEGVEKGYTDGKNYEISDFYSETDDIISKSQFVKVYKLTIDENLSDNSDSVLAEEYDSIDCVGYIRDNRDHYYKGDYAYDYYFQLLFANKTLENQIYWDMDGDANTGFVYDIATKKFEANGYANLTLSFNEDEFGFGNLFDDDTNRRLSKGIEFAPFVYGKDYSRFFAFNQAFNQSIYDYIVGGAYSIEYGNPKELPYGFVKLAGDNTLANIVTLSDEFRASGVIAGFVIYGIENNKIRVLNFADDIDVEISFDDIKGSLFLENNISSIKLSEQNGQCFASIKLEDSDVVEAFISPIGTVLANDGIADNLSVNQLVPTFSN